MNISKKYLSKSYLHCSSPGRRGALLKEMIRINTQDCKDVIQKNVFGPLPLSTLRGIPIIQVDRSIARNKTYFSVNSLNSSLFSSFTFKSMS